MKLNMQIMTFNEYQTATCELLMIWEDRVHKEVHGIYIMHDYTVHTHTHTHTHTHAHKYIYIYIYIHIIIFYLCMLQNSSLVSFFKKRLIYCSEMYKCLHEFPLKLFQIPVYMRLLTEFRQLKCITLQQHLCLRQWKKLSTIRKNTALSG